MPHKHNDPPKYTKPFISWKGRAKALQTYLESIGHSVDYQADWAVVMFAGQVRNKRRWWHLLAWWW